MLSVRRNGLGQVSLAIIPAVWIGLLIGVSFIATPAKFLASSLALPVALDVGRATFAVWNAIEWGVLVLLALIGFLGKAGRIFEIAIAFLISALLIQTFHLLPILNERVLMIIGGKQPEASSVHLFYIVMEVAKLQILGVLVWWQGCRLVRPQD